MNFIAREEETLAIQNLLKKKGYQGGIVYGRRRTGKTELIVITGNNRRHKKVRTIAKQAMIHVAIIRIYLFY